MDLLGKIFNKPIEFVTNKATANLISYVDRSLAKASPSPRSAPAKIIRYQFDPNTVNANTQQRKKPGGSISYDALRNFSELHEVTRACINLRKRQMTGLEWDIVTTDTEDTNAYTSDVAALKQWFRNLGGPGMGYRKFMNRFIEDLLVLDAIALERQRTIGGGLYTLIPVDASTIRLIVDQSGGTPMPPDAAYRQYIRGQMVGEYTTEELIYDMMNPRNNTPYGLAPLESLVVIVTSSLKAGMYNLGYLTDGNIPEGLLAVPDGWTPAMIQEFQNNFDAAMAGDETASSRLKMVPGNYTPTKKREDMQFSEFNEWLMKITCALFEVQPQEIGFFPKNGLGGKGFTEGQNDVTNYKAIRPMAQFIQEIFDRLIAEDLGMPHLRFGFKGLDQRDERAEAEVNEIKIRSGQRTINEVRTDDGLDPIEGLDKPLFGGTFQFIDPESMQQAAEERQQANTARADALAANTQQDDNEGDSKKSADISANLVDELRKYRRYAIGKIRDGKSIKKFQSDILPESVIEEINKRLDGCSDVEQAKQLFSKYFDDVQISFLADVVELKQAISRVGR